MISLSSRPFSKATLGALLFATSSLGVGCAADASPPPGTGSGNNTGVTNGGAGSSGTLGAGGSGVATGGGSTTGGGTPGAVQPLPVIIDAFFAPSGYMEDARNGNATMIPAFDGDDTTCKGNRAPSGRGFCHVVTFSMFASGGLMWGGVFWQYPGNNWGTMPGLKVAPGATKVRFMARGDKGGETVGFFAGIVPKTGPAPHADGFEVTNQDKKLTTDWQEYSLPLPASANYGDGVVGPFGWGLGANGNTLPVKFYVDDITFE